MLHGLTTPFDAIPMVTVVAVDNNGVIYMPADLNNAIYAIRTQR